MNHKQFNDNNDLNKGNIKGDKLIQLLELFQNYRICLNISDKKFRE